jgi:hypothetical protein
MGISGDASLSIGAQQGAPAQFTNSCMCDRAPQVRGDNENELKCFHEVPLKITATVKTNFDPDRIVKHAKRLAFNKVLSDARDKARGMRCAEHGEKAEITLQENGNDVSLAISGCCDDFRKQVAKDVLSK